MVQKNKSFVFSNSGLSVLEVLIGGALIVFVGFGGLTAYNQLTKIEHGNSVSSTAEDRMSEIIENIRQQPTSQIIQYSDDPQSLLSPNNLRMAWSLQKEGPVESCDECPGRYGYVITPLSKAMGDLYLVTVFFTYKDWTEPRKYEFLVNK